ncbi:MAG: hypothetical protein AAGH81_15530 [Bacteroidota bacterium]
MDQSDLRELRKMTGRKPEEIAKEIHVHEKTLFKMEREFRANHYVKFLKLLRGEGQDINKFLDGL